jgi:hypothetical protein
VTHHQTPANDPVTASGLILSLAGTMDRSDPLARQARRTARRLARFQRPPAYMLLEVAELTAQLLDSTDDLATFDDVDLLDSAWDDF